MKEELLAYLKVKIDELEENYHVRKANTCRNYLDVKVTSSEAMNAGGAQDDHVQPKNPTTREIQTRTGKKKTTIGL